MEAEQIESRVVASSDEALDCWAFVEIMGHTKIAGRLTTRKLGVNVMLQVDVLKADGSEASYSKLFAPASLFSVTPCSREFCQRWSAEAARYGARPIPFVESPKQIASGDPTKQDDFFEWCKANGFEDIDAPDAVRDPDRLEDALSSYEKRKDPDLEDDEF